MRKYLKSFSFFFFWYKNNSIGYILISGVLRDFEFVPEGKSKWSFFFFLIDAEALVHLFNLPWIFQPDQRFYDKYTKSYKNYINAGDGVGR